MESIGECEYEKTQERKENEIQNLCITCKRDMGPDNPRQLCGKFKCDYIEYMSEDEEIHEPNETTSNEEKYNKIYYEIVKIFSSYTDIQKDLKISVKKIKELIENNEIYLGKYKFKLF